MRLSLIVAMTRGGVIGHRGGLPWRLSADLKRFKSLTMGHHLLMGRKTFESLGRVLPGRVSVVITRQSGFPLPPAVLRANDLESALVLAAADDEPFVIGGAEIYRLAFPHVDRLYVTWVEADIPGDTFFPPVDWSQWREISCEPHSADEKNEYATLFTVYDRLVRPEPRLA
jgi:dihydrofolate reductase